MDTPRTKDTRPSHFHLKPLTVAIRTAIPVTLLGLPVTPQAGPEGGVVTAGSGTVARPDARTTNIQQHSQNLILNWDSYNVQANEAVNYRQPNANAQALNRILDHNPSQIFGQINANGKVLLVNPNGVFFKPGARVNVGGLVASGLNISDQDFLAGKYHFANAEGNPGAVINQGLIQAATGGAVSLIGGAVKNEGAILAHAGQVNLVAGRAMTMDFDGDGLIQFAVTEELLERAEGLEAAVSNTGAIKAEGGAVLLKGRAARDVFTQVVNNSGVIGAGRVESNGGVIRLVAEGPGNSLINTGTLNAASEKGAGGAVKLEAGGQVEVSGEARITAASRSGQGGRIDISGADVAVSGSARLDVSSAFAQGGIIKLKAKGKAAVSDKARITAASKTRQGGQIDISGGEVAISGNTQITAASGITAVSGTGQGQTGDTLPDVDSGLRRAATGVLPINDAEGADSKGLATNNQTRHSSESWNPGKTTHSGAGRNDFSGLAGGTIHIKAKNKVAVSGKAQITAVSETGKGGQIQITGDKVGLLGQVRLDASGAAGGGEILAGGDYQGKNPAVKNARVTYVGKGARLSADATKQGKGGRIIVWADDTTRYHGRISAKGGQISGDGGFVEVSGKRYLAFRGKVDVAAPKGRAGTLLLDPNDLCIGGNKSCTKGTTATEDTNAGDDNIFDAAGDKNSWVSEKTLKDVGNADIILQASNNIFFDASIDLGKSYTRDFRLLAGGSINMNGNNLTLPNGAARFYAGGTVTVTEESDGFVITRRIFKEGDIHLGGVTAKTLYLSATGRVTHSRALTVSNLRLNFPRPARAGVTGTFANSQSYMGAYMLNSREESDIDKLYVHGVLGGDLRLADEDGFRIASPINTGAGKPNTLELRSEGEITQDKDAVISGTGKLLKSGPGRLTLSAANSYSGETNVNGGALRITHADALGTPAKGKDGKVPASATTLGPKTRLELEGGKEGLKINAGESLTLNGGILRNVSGNNIWRGPLTLKQPGKDNPSAIESAAGSALTINRDLSLQQGEAKKATPVNLHISGAGNVVLAGVISGAGGLVKQDAGTLTLSQVNRYRGATTIKAGTLRIYRDGALGAAGGGGTTVNTGGILELQSFDKRPFKSEALTLAGGALRSGRGDNTWAGAIKLTKDSAIQSAAGSTLIINPALSLQQGETGKVTPKVKKGISKSKKVTPVNLNVSGAGNVEFAGVISGAGGLSKQGGGDLRLATDNSYTGETLIKAGRLLLSDKGSAGRSVLVLDGATHDLQGRDQIWAGLRLLSGAIRSGEEARPGVGRLIVNRPGKKDRAGESVGQFDLRSGTVGAELAGTGDLVKKAGASAIKFNTVILSVAASYTGETRVEAGRLALGVNDAIALSRQLRVAGGTFDLGRFNTRVARVELRAGHISRAPGALPREGVLTVDAASDKEKAGQFDLRQGTVSAVLAGSGALIKRAVNEKTKGIVTLGAANRYTGLTTVDQGTLIVSHSDALGTPPDGPNNTGVRVNANGVLELRNDITVSGETLTLNGGTLRGYGSKNVTTWAGRIILRAASALSATGAFIDAPAKLAGLGARLRVTGPVFNNGHLLTLDASGADTHQHDGRTERRGRSEITISGAITGAGGLRKQGDGAAILKGRNDYRGRTHIAAGILTLQGGQAIHDEGAVHIGPLASSLAIMPARHGDKEVIAGPQLVIAGSETIGPLSGGGNVAISADRRTRATLTVNNPKGKDSVYAGVISGALGNLTKKGAGALTLGGHNTYGGETIVQGGILRITDEDALGAPAAETLINPGAALELQGGINVPEALTLNGGTLRNASGDNTWDGRINLSANSAIESATGTLTVNGRLRLQDLPVGNSAAAATRLSLAGRGQIILARAISGLGGLRKTGPGSLTLSGTNTYRGKTEINAGQLILKGGNAILNTGAVTLADVANARLTLRDDETIGTLSGGGGKGGNIEITRGKTLTVNQSNDAVYNGAISEIGASGTKQAHLAKTGAGRLTLGGDSSYTGNTEARQGVLAITHGNALGKGKGEAGRVSVSNGATLELAAPAGGPNLSLGKSLTLNGQGVNTGGEAGPVYAGALRNTSGSNIWSGAIRLAGNATIHNASVVSGAAPSLTLNNTLTLQSTATSPVAADLTLTGAGKTTINSAISGAGGLTKAGTGTLTLSGAGENTYAGVTAVDEGILRISKSSALGTPTSGLTRTIVKKGATLQLAGSDLDIYAEELTLNGGTLHSLRGKNSRSHDNTWSRNIDLTDDSRILAESAFGAPKGARLTLGGEINLRGHTLTLDAAGPATRMVNGVRQSRAASRMTVRRAQVPELYLRYFTSITGTGGLIKAGGGQVVLLSRNDYTGRTHIEAGELILDGRYGASVIDDAGAVSLNTATSGNTARLIVWSSETIGALSGGSSAGGNIVIIVGQTLTVNSAASDNTTYSGVISEGGVYKGWRGNLAKTGPGRLTLGGANTYTGTTTINNGVLAITNRGALGTGTTGRVIVNSSGANSGTLELRLTGTNNIGKLLTLNGLGATDSGARLGALRNISGINTWTGAITLGATAAIHNADTANALTISGVISGINFGLSKTGAGTLTLSGTNTYTGATRVEGGTLKLGQNDAINKDSALIVNDGTFDLAGWNNTFGGVQLLNGTITDSGRDKDGATKGALTLSGGNYDLQDGTVNAILAGGASVGLTKRDRGTVTLTAANTYGGETTINAGTLKIQNAGALGNTASGTTVNDGGTLELDLPAGTNSVTGEALTLNGTGDNRGTLRNTRGTNTWDGAITLAGNGGRIDGAGGLTLAGPIDGTTAGQQDLRLAGSLTARFNGAVGGTVALRDFTVAGATQVILNADLTATRRVTFRNITAAEAVNQTGGVLRAAELLLRDYNGRTSLTGQNDVRTLAGANLGGQLNFAGRGGFTVGTVGGLPGAPQTGVSGITNNTAVILVAGLAETGTLNIGADIRAGSGEVRLTNQNGDINGAGGVVATSSRLKVTASGGVGIGTGAAFRTEFTGTEAGSLNISTSGAGAAGNINLIDPGLNTRVLALNTDDTTAQTIHLRRHSGEGRNPGTTTSGLPAAGRRSRTPILVNSTTAGATNLDANDTLIFDGPATINSDINTNNPAFTFNGPVTTAANRRINTGRGALTFRSTLNAGANTLALISRRLTLTDDVTASALDMSGSTELVIAGNSPTLNVNPANIRFPDTMTGRGALTIPGVNSQNFDVGAGLRLPANMQGYRGHLIIGGRLTPEGMSPWHAPAMTGIKVNAPRLSVSRAIETGGPVTLLGGDIGLNANIRTGGQLGLLAVGPSVPGLAGSRGVIEAPAGPITLTAPAGASGTFIASERFVNAASITLAFAGGRINAAAGQGGAVGFNPNSAFAGQSATAGFVAFLQRLDAVLSADTAMNVQPARAFLATDSGVNPVDTVPAAGLQAPAQDGLFEQELTLLNAIGGGIALALANARDKAAARPTPACCERVTLEELDLLIAQLEARLAGPERRPVAADTAGQVSTDRGRAAYRRELQNFLDYRAALQKYTPDAEADLSDKDFGRSPGAGGVTDEIARLNRALAGVRARLQWLESLSAGPAERDRPGQAAAALVPERLTGIIEATRAQAVSIENQLRRLFKGAGAMLPAAPDFKAEVGGYESIDIAHYGEPLNIPALMGGMGWY